MHSQHGRHAHCAPVTRGTARLCVCKHSRRNKHSYQTISSTREPPFKNTGQLSTYDCNNPTQKHTPHSDRNSFSAAGRSYHRTAAAICCRCCMMAAVAAAIAAAIGAAAFRCCLCCCCLLFLFRAWLLWCPFLLADFQALEQLWLARPQVIHKLLCNVAMERWQQHTLRQFSMNSGGACAVAGHTH